MEKLKTGAVPGRTRKIVYSTTDGRQRFPDILQTSYGEKAVIGFDRYGRALGALVPMEAVQILAGAMESVDEDIRGRIQRAAQALLETMADHSPAMELDELDRLRREHRRVQDEGSTDADKPGRRKRG
jgi:hypothetical protein